MPLNPNAIVSIDEAKTALRATTDTLDARIESIINALSNTFEDQIDRMIKKRTLTDFRVDGNGRNRMFLPWAPVQAVNAIKLNYDYNDALYKSVDPTKWVLKDKGLGYLQLIEDVFIIGKRNILITMDVGFNDSDPDMAGIRELFFIQLVFDFKRWDMYHSGIVSRTFENGSISFVPPQQLLKEVQEGLASLRDVRFGETSHRSIYDSGYAGTQGYGSGGYGGGGPLY